MDERKWQQDIRTAERRVRDYKRDLTPYYLGLGGVLVLVALFATLSLTVDPSFAVFGTMLLTAGVAAMCGFMPEYMDDRKAWVHAKDALEDLREDYAYAMMSAYNGGK